MIEQRELKSNNFTLKLEISTSNIEAHSLMTENLNIIRNTEQTINNISSNLLDTLEYNLDQQRNIRKGNLDAKLRPRSG